MYAILTGGMCLDSGMYVILTDAASQEHVCDPHLQDGSVCRRRCKSHKVLVSHCVSHCVAYPASAVSACVFTRQCPVCLCIFFNGQMLKDVSFWL